MRCQLALFWCMQQAGHARVNEICARVSLFRAHVESNIAVFFYVDNFKVYSQPKCI
jgi:hypothetical protein